MAPRPSATAAALPNFDELLGRAEEAARDMREAEEALELVRRRFEYAEDPAERDGLAAEALDCVERQLNLARERRRQLDSVEAKLWARRNRIERLLIHARGSGWWRAHRNLAKGETSPDRRDGSPELPRSGDKLRSHSRNADREDQWPPAPT